MPFDSSQLDMSELALRTHANGYAVVPIGYRRKNPTIAGWRNLSWEDAPAATIEAYYRKNPKHGFGLACGFRTIAVDIDLTDPELAESALKLAEDLLGPTPLKRVGRAPRMALIYRVTSPMISTRIPDLDIIGLGSHIAAFGEHPLTLQPYRWVGEGSPADTPLSELPVADFDTLYKLVLAFGELTGQDLEGLRFDLDVRPMLRLMSSRTTLLRQLFSCFFFGRDHAFRRAYLALEDERHSGAQWGLVFTPKGFSPMVDSIGFEDIAGQRRRREEPKRRS